MSSTTRRAGVSLAAAATLLLSTVGTAVAQPTTTDDPAAAAAGWLATQLTDGDHVSGEYEDGEGEMIAFVDQGLTADILYALAGVGVAAGTIGDMADWLETQTDSYTGPGATAKLILAAEIAERSATDFGGTDLIARLEGLETTDAPQDSEDPAVGLYAGAYTPLDQALAVLALARVDGVTPSESAVQVLLDHQCAGGGFSGLLLEPDATCQGGSVDVTAFAVDALLAVGSDDAADAAGNAVAWLADEQAGDGSFIGDAGPSSNSTGLAALALRLGGEDERADAARDWVLGQQAGCDTSTPGAILADPDGIGQAIRATPQALLGVIGQSLTTISAQGASSDAPLLDCPEPQPESRELTVACDADEVVPGDRVACEIDGLDAGEVVHVLVTLNPTLLDEDVTANDTGTAGFAFDVPEDAEVGDTISITINGEGDALLAELSLTVGAAEPDPVDEPEEGTEADDGELPRTGASAVHSGGIAALLLALGGLLLVGTRRGTELT